MLFKRACAVREHLGEPSTPFCFVALLAAEASTSEHRGCQLGLSIQGAWAESAAGRLGGGRKHAETTPEKAPKSPSSPTLEHLGMLRNATHALSGRSLPGIRLSLESWYRALRGWSFAQVALRWETFGVQIKEIRELPALRNVLVALVLMFLF